KRCVDIDLRVVEALKPMSTGIFSFLAHQSNKTILLAGVADDTKQADLVGSLCTVMANANNRVVVIDADLITSSVSSYFNIESDKAGLADFLKGDKVLDEVVISIDDRLSVLPAGNTSSSTKNLLTNCDLSTVFTDLQNKFDVVIISGPSFLSSTDSIVLMQHVLATFIVARIRYSSFNQVENALKQAKIA